MKKCFIYFIFICVISVVGIKFSYASTDLQGSLYVSTSKQASKYTTRLNLFNLIYNDSGFTENLLLQGTDFVTWSLDELNLSISDFSDSSYYYASLVSVDDFYHVKLTYSTYNSSLGSYSTDYYYDIGYDIDSDNFTGFDVLFTETSNYVYAYSKSGYSYDIDIETFYLDDYSEGDISYVMMLSSPINFTNFDGISYGRNLSFNVDIYNDVVYAYIKGRFTYFVYYNSDGDIVGYTHILYNRSSSSSMSMDEYYSYYGLWYLIVDTFSVSDSVDMTSWYSYAFKTEISSNYYDKMYSYYFYLPSHDSYVMLDGNAGVGTIKNFFLNFFNSDYMYVDLSKYNLNFVYSYPFYKSSGYSTMWQYWLYSNQNEVSVPDDFEYITISDWDKGYYLVPISGCTADNYMLYYYSNNNASDYKLYFNYYNFDTDSWSLEYNSSYYAYASLDYYLYSYSPLVDLSINSSNYYNILINVYQNSVLFDYYLYYNPSCYNVYSSNSSVDVSFSDDNIYTLSLTDQATMYSNYNVNGGNYVGSSTASSSTSNTLDNGTYDGYNLSSATSASDLLATATSSISGITGTISGLVYMGTVFFTGLPTGMQSVLYSFFILGFVIVILKMLF